MLLIHALTQSLTHSLTHSLTRDEARGHSDGTIPWTTCLSMGLGDIPLPGHAILYNTLSHAAKVHARKPDLIVRKHHAFSFSLAHSITQSLTLRMKLGHLP